MAIHQEEVQEIQGFDKKIEESALGMILGNLQVSQYQYPQKSTIRELASNAMDAIREKDIAIGILSGALKEEDYYLRRDDELYKDSNFDVSYYDPQWLADSFTPLSDGRYPSKVFITYVDGGTDKRDKLVIEDFGVGLGGVRLEKYFNLGYSTKRNTKLALGKFGIGAKAGLSTMPYYTMTTRYNGREYSFQIYERKIVPIITRWSDDSDEENPIHVFENGFEVYYKRTDKPNGTIIEIDSKKHYKSTYIEAVKSQLLYFDNIDFRVVDEDGDVDKIHTQAEILYENDTIVLSNNHQYSKPHLLINKINYGNIDFKELELEDVMGNIGIKVSAEEVAVNPSRESVVWNEQTKTLVSEKFEKVISLAETIIQEEIDTHDFIEWLRRCSQIQGKNTKIDSVLGRLSKIIDLGKAKIKFPSNKEIIYNQKVLRGFAIYKVSLDEKRSGAKINYKLKWDAVDSEDFARELPVFFSTMDKDTMDAGFMKYVLTNMHSELLVFSPVLNDYTHECSNYAEFNKLDMDVALKQMLVIQNLLMASPHLEFLDCIEVPADFDRTMEIVIEQEKKTVITEQAAKLRYARPKDVIPVFTPRAVEPNKYERLHGRGAFGSHSVGQGYTHKLYEWQKIEMPLSDIDSWSNREVFFASDAKQDDGSYQSDLLHIAAFLTRPARDVVGTAAIDVDDNTYGMSVENCDNCHNFFPAAKVKLIRVANDRKKYLQDFKPIEKFFLDIKGSKLTMSTALIEWNTSRLMVKEMDSLKFLANYGLFHSDHHLLYKKLRKYFNTYYRDADKYVHERDYHAFSKDAYDNLITHLDKVSQFQLLIRDSPDDKDGIAAIAKSTFDADGIDSAAAIDLSIYDDFKMLLDYYMPVMVMLNEIPVLSGTSSIPAELEQEIRGYLAFKNVKTM